MATLPIDLIAVLRTALPEHYVLQRELGRGGMATVFLARDLRNERSVAIKVLDPELGAVLGAERFLSEIRVTANLQHPNLLPLFDSGEANGLLYYVMPYVEGESLRARLDRERQLPIHDAVAIAVAIAGALDYAHQNGVIHRDLKPENILLQHGQPMLADFGIALAVSKAGGQRVTQTGLSLGTPQYMSPEQATGDRVVDARSDIYSLGAVTYEMLAGEPPHSGSSAQAVIARLMTEEPRPITAARKHVPAHVEAAVVHALEKLPADRFASAREFAEALSGRSGVVATNGDARAKRSGSSARTRLLQGTAAVLVFAAGVATMRILAPRAQPDRSALPLMRFEITLPDSVDVVRASITGAGDQIALTTTQGGYLYSLADRSLRRVSGEREGWVSVSPGGTWMVMRDWTSQPAPTRIVRRNGGVARTLDESINNLSWLGDSVVLAVRTRDRRQEVVRYNLGQNSSAPEIIARFDSGSATSMVLEPAPSGRWVAMWNNRVVSDTQRIEIRRVDLRSGEVRTTIGNLPAGHRPLSVLRSGYLLSVRGSSSQGNPLYATPIDLEKGTIVGEPVEVLDSFKGFAPGATIVYTPVYRWGLARVTRAGTTSILPKVAVDEFPRHPALSPDGNTLVFSTREMTPARETTWTYQLPEGPATRLASREFEGSFAFGGDIAWSADGRAIHSFLYGCACVLSTSVDGSRSDTIARTGFPISAVTSIPGTTRLLVARSLTGPVRILGMPGDSMLATVIDSIPGVVTGQRVRGQNFRPVVSPNGRWVAFQQEVSGRQEVFIKSLDGGAARWRVSTDSGGIPMWARSGKELFFLSHDSLWVAAVEFSPTPVVGRARALFPVESGLNPYAVMPGDASFVFARRIDPGNRLVVLVNFEDEVARIAGRRAP